MSVETATTSDISAMYHATSEALGEHGTPAFGDNYSGDVEGLPVSETGSRYTLLLASAAIAGIRASVGAFTPDGMSLRGIREVNVSFEEPHLTVVPNAEDVEEETNYEYNAAKCSWRIDRGRSEVEVVTVEPGWDQRTGPTYEVKRSMDPRGRDEQISLTPTDKTEGVAGDADTAENQVESTVSRRLARTLFILAGHFGTVAEQNDKVLLEALA